MTVKLSPRDRDVWLPILFAHAGLFSHLLFSDRLYNSRKAKNISRVIVLYINKIKNHKPRRTYGLLRV